MLPRRGNRLTRSDGGLHLKPRVAMPPHPHTKLKFSEVQITVSKRARQPVSRVWVTHQADHQAARHARHPTRTPHTASATHPRPGMGNMARLGPGIAAMLLLLAAGVAAQSDPALDPENVSTPGSLRRVPRFPGKQQARTYARRRPQRTCTMHMHNCLRCAHPVDTATPPPSNAAPR